MRTLFSLIVVALLLVMPVAVLADQVDAILVADGGSTATETPVGIVSVWNDGDYIYVKYELTADSLYLDRTHLHIDSDLSSEVDDVPQVNGNPIPGAFEYNEEHGLGIANYTYKIPLGDEGSGDMIVAAHADVCQGIYANGGSLPVTVFAHPLDRDVQYGDPSYFDVEITDGGILDGRFESYCIDTDAPIYTCQTYPANVYSSYGTLPGVLEYPGSDNMDLVNWVVNQNYVGQVSPGGHGIYTFGDVQKAIWELVEDVINPLAIAALTALVDWDQDRVDEIVEAAYANGEGFEPGCGGVIAIIIVPLLDGTEGEIQLFIVLIPVKCCETAWGSLKEGVPPYDSTLPGAEDGRDDSYGYDFPGKNWAHYFYYTVQNGNGAPPRMSLDSSVTTTWGSIKNR